MTITDPDGDVVPAPRLPLRLEVSAAAALARHHDIVTAFAESLRMPEALTKQLEASSAATASLRVDIDTALADQFREFSKQAAESWAYIGDAVGKAAKMFQDQDGQLLEYADSAVLLGRSGWTLPMDLPVHPTVEILRDLREGDDCDAAFETLYVEHDGAHLRDLFKSLEENPGLEIWRPMLSECIESYFDERYLVALPALVSVFEGMLALVLGEFRKWPQPVKSTRAKLDTSKTGMDRVIWGSVVGFVAWLFAFSDFAADAPKLNRHWMLHGRSSSGWQRVDVIRMFHAVHTLSCLLPREPRGAATV